MQRQSLGSPVSKLHGHGGGGAANDDTLVADDTKRKNLPSPSLAAADYDEEDSKSSKPRRFSSSASSSLISSLSCPPTSNPEKLIHLIPLLTIFCFLVLYLASHSPSQSDLAQFNGFQRLSKQTDLELSKISELRRGDVLAIRSLRKLREVATDKSKYRSHRKVADF